MTEPIKQKKKPVAKLDKILLDQPGVNLPIKAPVPAPVKAPDQGTHVPVKAPGPVPAPMKAPDQGNPVTVKAPDQGNSVPVKAPEPVPVKAPGPVPVKAPGPINKSSQVKSHAKTNLVTTTDKESLNPNGQQVPINAPLSQLNLDVPADSIVSQQVPNVTDPAPAKKRGRKRKIALSPKYFDTNYITMWPEICMGKCVLVDRYDNVYSYDLEVPHWLGVKTVYGKIDNTPGTVPRTDYKYG